MQRRLPCGWYIYREKHSGINELDKKNNLHHKLAVAQTTHFSFLTPGLFAYVTSFHTVNSC